LLLRTLGRHWLAILAVWLLGTGAAWVIARSVIQPIYRASSMLRADPTITDLIQVPGAVDELEPYLQTQVQLITSPRVLGIAAANPKVAALGRIAGAADGAEELRKAVQVSIRPATYLIEMAMTSPDPAEAATIVNAIVDAFLGVAGPSLDGLARHEIKNLETYQVDLRNQVVELERRWKALAAREDLALTADPTVKVKDQDEPRNPDSIVIEENRKIRQESNATQLELIRAQAWLTTAQEEVSQADGRNPLDRQVRRRLRLDPQVNQILGDLQKAEARLNKARQANALAAAGSAKVKLDSLAVRYTQMIDEKSKALRERIAPDGKTPAPDQEVQEAEAAVKELLARQARTKARFEELDIQSGRQTTETLEIALIQDAHATLKSMLDSVARRLEQLRRAKGEIRSVHPDGIGVPTRPISDPLGLIMIPTPFVMLLAVVGLFAGFEAWSGSTVLKNKAEPMREV
jgi:hypothetical protein